MAQIDPSIALGVRPLQIESPVNQMRAMMELQSAQQQQQANALKMQEYQQQQAERNALARIISDPSMQFGSEPFMRRVLAEAPGQYEGIAARATQREALEAQREERVQRKEEREQKLSKEQLDTAIADIAGFDTLQDIQADIQRKVASGELKPEYADRVISGLPASDAEVPAWQLRTLRGLLSAKDRLTDVRAEKKDIRESARVDLEDARVRETQRHQQAMERISQAGVDRQRLQMEETQRHNRAMENIDARRVGITEAAEKRKAEMGDTALSTKDIQKREAVFPQATAAIKGVEAKSNSFVKDLQDLANHPGLSQITGLIAGRAPGITAEGRAAQALYDKIMARGGFQALQEMRDMSKTGGALGNVSNQEGKQLQASFAAIDRRQDAADVKKAIDQAIADIEGAKVRMREAYNDTYAYREKREGGAAAPATPAAPKPPAVGTVQDGYRFKGGNPADQKNWEKVK